MPLQLDTLEATVSGIGQEILPTYSAGGGGEMVRE